VRPVDRFGFVCNFKHASNIVKTWHDLPSSSSRCPCSAFHTLQRVRCREKTIFAFVRAICLTRTESKSFLAQALKSAQKAGGFATGRARAAAGSDAARRALS
jgi:hypothetical protein